MREYPETKRCSKCRRELPRSEFYKSKARPDGIQTVCKDCTRLNNRAWRAANPGAHRRHYAAYEMTAEQCSQRDDRAKAWRAANPERKRRNAERWLAANPEKAREIARKRTATRKARKLGAFVEVVVELVVLERADGICGICGEDVDPLAFEVDHVIPLARGGEHSYANTQPAHRLCNRRKWARLPDAA